MLLYQLSGKTTDRLLKEAHELSDIPSERELDVLLSTGEQVSISKLSILLNEMGYKAVSLTGWQAGIFTNTANQSATIKCIDTSRILNELSDRKIVIVAGFQGIDEQLNITTLGRGGSDTTAVALAAALKAKHCYIFSDVDGVYSTDPKCVKEAKKLNNISYDEMIDIANEGAKVLHPRCVELGQKYCIPIVAKSTFIENEGTIIDDKLEEKDVKNIVKNDNIIYVNVKYKNNLEDLFNNLYESFIINGLDVKNLVNSSEENFEISFTINKQNFDKLQKLLKEKYDFIEYHYREISRISIIGNGVTKDNIILEHIMNIIQQNKLNILSMEINESKIAIMFKNSVSNSVLQQMHSVLIK